MTGYWVTEITGAMYKGYYPNPLRFRTTKGPRKKREILASFASPRARSVETETEKILLFDRLAAQTQPLLKKIFETAKMNSKYAGDPKVMLHLSSRLIPYTGYHEH